MYSLHPDLIVFYLVLISSVCVTSTKNNNNKKDSVLGKCTRCRFLANSILEIAQSYSRDSDEFFDKKDFNDADKFNEIKKTIDFAQLRNKLCHNLKLGKNDCRSLVEENLDLIEFWWKNNYKFVHDDDDDKDNVVFDQLCIETLRFCCPENRYGSECLPCPGYPLRVCSNNGKCAGAGTRLGNGHCVCKRGYAGDKCEKCEQHYFANRNLEDGTVECLPCDASCAHTCFASGPRGCHVCKKGFTWDNDYGCFDVDECAPDYANECPSNSFCINTEGSYQCYQCDHACDGCDGDGPDSCLKCAKDFVLKDKVCINPNPPPLFDIPASPIRYITYLGLCLVTCITFRHNVLLTSIIGLSVALYIMFSERSLNTEYGRAIDQWWTKVSG